MVEDAPNENFSFLVSLALAQSPGFVPSHQDMVEPPVLAPPYVLGSHSVTGEWTPGDREECQDLVPSSPIIQSSSRRKGVRRLYMGRHLGVDTRGVWSTQGRLRKGCCHTPWYSTSGKSMEVGSKTY